MRTRAHLARMRDHSQPIKRRHHAWPCTRYGALHPLRGAAPVAGRCTRSERVQCLRIGCTALAGKNACGTCNPATRKKAASTPLHEPRDLVGRLSGDIARGSARCGALHPLRGAAPDQSGCNAYGSGVPCSQARTRAEPGIPQRERRRPKRPYTRPGTWQAN